MEPRRIRLRFRRHWRKGQRQVEDMGSQAEQGIETHLFKRFDRLVPVQRFVFGWISLMLLLILGVIAQNIWLSGYYQTIQPVPGGIYNEGVKGRITNVNPIYASSDADKTISKLIFAGLLTYNDEGKLVGNLASDYSVDAKGSTYTVHLKPGLTWQDGQPLTSQDVLYTFQAIQNPDVESPYQGGWKGVVVAAPDLRTVVFKLPGVLAPFPESLTMGIIPKHKLEKIPPTEMRSADFNTVNPIGAGPFKWDAIQVSNSGDPAKAKAQVALMPFTEFQSGAPKLQKFVVHVFAAEEDLVKAFKDKQLYAIEGLNAVPEYAKDDEAILQHNLMLRAADMVFFKTSSGVLADKAFRQALVTGSNVPDIIKRLEYKTRAVREPLLAGQLAYDPKLVQSAYDLKSAQKQLDSIGWVVGKDGYRYKSGQVLRFGLVSANSPESRMVSQQLKNQWQALGVKVNVQFKDASEFQNSVANHEYDAILNGISIGVDPDVFVYWDSSQADIRSSNRLNLSEYKNATADASLEAGRTRIDPALRTIKYKPFLQSWQQDNPALGLYQPRVLYLTNGPVAGLSENAINNPTERLNNVQNWQIRQAKVTNK